MTSSKKSSGAMAEILDFLLKLVRILKPQHNHWVVRVLFVAGLGMLSQPWWVPLLNSVFEKQFDVVIGFEVTGWVVLGLGIGFHFLNRYEEKAQLADGGKLTREKSRDYRTLRQLLESIHSPTFDEFIDYGRRSYVLSRIFHFWEGFRYLVEGSDFHIHDTELARRITDLYDAWDRSLSFGEFFTDTNNASLHRFMNRWETHGQDGFDGAYDEFTKAILESDTAFRDLIGLIRSKYPDIDIDATNEVAWRDYVSFMQDKKSET